MSILYVSASILGNQSKSGLIGEEFLSELTSLQPRKRVVRREVSALPHIDGAGLATITPLTEALISEVEEADAIIIAAPMYNFSVSSGLKAWIDHIARSGRTFRYSAEGRPEGLLKGKKVYVVASRGGLYANNGPAAAMDFQEPYLRAMLGFLGLTDVSFIHVEGQMMGPEAAANGLGHARKQMSDLLTVAKAA